MWDDMDDFGAESLKAPSPSSDSESDSDRTLVVCKSDSIVREFLDARVFLLDILDA